MIRRLSPTYDLYSFFFVLYWFASFLRFRPLPSSNPRYASVSTIENIYNSLLDLSEPILIYTLLFGSDSFDTNASTNVLNATIEYTLSTK